MEGGFDGDLLRRDPAAFFGLTKGFDAKDLRRAYHAAIRRFRPDSHPREFQLLREAHDRLARWIGPGAAHRDPGSTGEIARPSPAAGPLDTPARRSAAYAERAVDPRAPGDFVALALLAESISGADRGFDSWILAGLAVHPGDDGLESLLRIYQQEDLVPGELPRFLRRAWTALPPRVAWRLTNYAWESAALEFSFLEFLALWEQCRSPEDDIDEQPRAALLAHLLPLLAPSANRKWLAETMSWLGKRHDLLGDGGAVLDAIEAWMPLRDAVDEGRRSRHQRGEGAGGSRWNPFRKGPAEPVRFPRGPDGDAVKDMVSALLAAGCRDGGERLNRAAAAVVARETGVLEAFRPPAAGLASTLARFARWAGPLAAHQPSFDPVREPKEEVNIVYAIHRRAEEVLQGTRDGFLMAISRNLGLAFLDQLTAIFGGILVLILFVAGIVLLSKGRAGETGGSVGGLIAGFVAVAGCLVGGFLLVRHQPTFWGRLQGRLALAMQRRCYFRRIRPVVVEAVRDLGLPPEALVDPQIIKAGDLHPIVAWAVAEDPALPVLRMAHRFAP